MTASSWVEGKNGSNLTFEPDDEVLVLGVVEPLWVAEDGVLVRGGKSKVRLDLRAALEVREILDQFAYSLLPKVDK
jgi:hypothetical protein